MGDAEHIVVQVEDDIANVAAAAWDGCANPRGEDGARIRPYNPFISHAFLKALEDAGCVDPKTGWMPQHLVIEDGSSGLTGAMPCYLKSHSMGEYVFDYAWADAFERAGGRYYPKLQVCVPFTPVTGRRLLVAPGAESGRVEDALLSAAIELVNRIGASSLHVTFPTEEEWRRLGAVGLLQRTDQQFHWLNQDYGSFDDFLGELTARKRKAIRKERREALGEDIAVEWVTGAALKEAHWDAFYEFYMDTGALNFIGSDTLYGRYWGCVEDHRFLHFELCYYQAIDYAIENGLAFVEAGAQGPHKLARGYMPKTTYSAHHIADPSLRRAVAQFLDRERNYVDMETRALAEHAPFRQDKPEGECDS